MKQNDELPEEILLTDNKTHEPCAKARTKYVRADKVEKLEAALKIAQEALGKIKRRSASLHRKAHEYSTAPHVGKSFLVTIDECDNALTATKETRER